MGGLLGVATVNRRDLPAGVLERMGRGLWSGSREPLSSVSREECFLASANQFSRWQGVFEGQDMVVACDAELFNVAEIQADLNRKNAQDHPALLIAELYRKHELDWMEKVVGSFAAAIWDVSRRRLQIVTDRFGIRPLVYTVVGSDVVFASKLKALLGYPLVSREIKPESVFNYLFFSAVPTPDTIFERIFKLPPGFFLTWEKGHIERRCYWDMVYSARSGMEYPSRLRDEVRSAVDRTLPTRDGERAGFFLSGGTDTSTLVGIQAERTRHKVKTFSIGFDVPHYNEIEFARVAARHFGTEHHEYFVTPRDTASALDIITQEYDEPFGNSSAVPTYYCAELARSQGVELLVAGDGGDELFGGNARYRTSNVLALYKAIPARVRRHFLEPLTIRFPQLGRAPIIGKLPKYVQRASLPTPTRIVSYNLLLTVPLQDIFTEDFLHQLNGMPALRVMESHFSQVRADTDLNRELYCDLKLTITDIDLRKVTRMTERAGVRARYPLLDHRLAEFSGTLPSSLKVRGLELRHVFKRAFRELLPREILKKKKHGFGLPWSVWLKTDRELQEIARSTLLDRSSLERGYFKRSFLENVFAASRNDSTSFYGTAVWLLMMLELWHREHFRAAAAA